MSEPRPHILIVDDERFFREAIRDALRAQAFECVLAESGAEALEAAGDPRIGVVVLDIRLPGMDGLEVLRRLRARRPALRVIVISAHADQEDVLEALRMDACDYLAKPLHDEELVLAVRRAAAAWELESSRARLHRRLLGLETWLQDIAARAGEGEEAGAAQIGARVCEAVAQLTAARKSSLMLLDADAGVLRVVATNGRYLEPRQMDPVRVGEGVAGLAFARGKPLAVADVEADERFAGRVPRDRYASRSLAVVPLGGGAVPAGVLCATDREDDAVFGDDELIPLRILALQTAQLLARRPASAAQEAAREAADPPADEPNADAELARRVCEALTREIEPERVIAAALRPVAEALDAAPVSLHLIDNAAGELALEGQVGADARPDRERLPRDRGLTGSVLQTGTLVASDHPETDPRFDLAVDTPRDGEVGPLLCVPLRLRGKVMGVARAFPGAGGRAAAATAELLASALSAAIRNVLLYRSLLDSIEEVAEARRQAEGRGVKELIDKADVLIEALPYIRRFRDKTFVVKYGGAAMTEPELRASFAVDVVLLRYIGLRPVIVHGGGPQIGRTLERLGKASTFIDGLRVTDDETMEVVEMVLGGKVNREIVDLVQRGGGRAVGLTGCDGGMLRVTQRLVADRDLGRVGRVQSVDPAPIEAVVDSGFIPVVAPIGIDAAGVTHNVNADEAAGAIARALRAEKLILLTNVEGVKDANERLIPQLRVDEARKLIAEGTIRAGMIPKIECCIDVLEGGVASAHVVDGRIVHAILLEIFTDGGVGTLLER